MEEQNKTETESFEKTVGRRPVFRVMAWVGVVVIVGLIAATFITGITGSPYFMACLALTMAVPFLIYIIIWLGKILNNRAKKQS